MKTESFIKWAGGKKYLLPTIKELLTQIDTANYHYHEPMVGGGAVLFSESEKFKSTSINDINDELINCYTTIKNDIDELIKELQNGEYKFVHKSDKQSATNYLNIRASTPTTTIKMAARTIFLLKTCFNGLMRKNKAGRFNVPMGSYTNPVVCDEQKLRLVSQFLQNVNISCGDATQYIQKLTNPTECFLFIDPPYHDESQKSKFTSYSGEFTEQHQIDLINAIKQSGCKFIYTNRSTQLIKTTFGTQYQYKEVPLKHSIQPKYTANVVETEIIYYKLS